MADFDTNRFKSTNQSGETPQYLFDAVQKQFGFFDCDVCASKDNTKCQKFYSEDNSCLDKEWSGLNWMNPPFKNMKVFIRKAYEQRENATTVCLIPARTNTAWWHDYCMNGEIHFIKGRPKFSGYKHGLPQPLALVIFGRLWRVVETFDIAKMQEKMEEKHG